LLRWRSSYSLVNDCGLKIEIINHEKQIGGSFGSNVPKILIRLSRPFIVEIE
jgi:hypothetical protein